MSLSINQFKDKYFNEEDNNSQKENNQYTTSIKQY